MKRNHGLVRSEVYTVDKIGEEAGIKDVSAIVSDTVDQAFYANEGTWPESFEITGYRVRLTDLNSLDQDVPLAQQDTMTGGSPIRYAGDIYQNGHNVVRVYYKGSMADATTSTGPTIYYNLDLGQVTLGELTNHTQLTGTVTGVHNSVETSGDTPGNTVGYFDIVFQVRFTGRTSDTTFNLDFYSSNNFNTPADRIQGIALRIKAIEFEVAIEGTSSILDGSPPPSEFIAQDQQQYSLGEGFFYRHKFRIRNARASGTQTQDVPIAWFEDPNVTNVTRTANILNQASADVRSGTTAGWPTVGTNITTYDLYAQSYTDSSSNLRPMSEKRINANYWPDRTTEGTEYFAPIMKAYYQDPDELAPSWHTIQWNAFAIQDYSTSAMGFQSSVTPATVNEGSSVTYYYNFYDNDQMDVLGYVKITPGTATAADFVTPVNVWLEINPYRIYNSALGQHTRTYAFTIQTASDSQFNESNETFSVDFAFQRADGSYNIITSATNRQIINVVPSPTAELVGVPLNVYYNSVSSDYTGAYDRYEIPVNNSTSSYKRLYFGIKIGTSTTFYNDVCVAGIAVLNSSGTVTHYDVFNSTSNQGWETTTTAINYTATTKPPLSNVASYLYSSISTSNGTTRIGLATSTGSSNTGMADGIASGSTSFTQSSSLVSQSSGTYYLYREASGSTRYSFAFARRASSILIPTNATIRIIAKFTTNSGMNGTFDPNDILFVGLY